MTDQVVLVPLDGSQVSEAALPLATAVALRREVPVVLLTVLPQDRDAFGSARRAVATSVRNGDSGTTLADANGSSKQATQEYLKRQAATISVAGAQVRLRVVTGHPALEIAREALDLKASLVVMASRGRSALASSVLGSVTDDVIRTSPAPVFIVRESNAPRTVDEARSFAHLIAPLDGSDLSEEVIPAVARLARSYPEAQVIFLRVLPGEEHRSRLVFVREQLALLAQASGIPADRVQVRVAVGDPVEEIVGFASRTPRSLIAMQTRGLGSARRGPRGSATEEVIRKATVPVLVTPPPT